MGEMDKGGVGIVAGRVAGEEPIRVMLVDDSAVVRGLITRMIEAESGIDVVASVGNGQLAVSGLARADADVVVLDIEMPVMDGLTALPKLLEIDPDIKVIMASTLTLRNAEVSIRALQAGASDYIPKPTAARDLSGTNEFRRELIEKIRSLGAAHKRGRGNRPAGRPARGGAMRAMPKPPAKPISLRAAGTLPVDVLAIGSSTGGPQALLSLLKGIPTNLRVPVFITQHMPATFTAVLADHIARTTGLACAEAKDGEVVTAGRVYLAPGNFHLIAERKGVQLVARLDGGPPENYCRPSVNPMLRSLARVYGGRVLTAILTGMGSDGLIGGRMIIEAGGTVIAQDEATSVVWGMPGAVATDGICSAVLPLSQMASYIMKMIGGTR